MENYNQKLKEFGKGFYDGFTTVTSFLSFMPTRNRKIRESELVNDITETERIGGNVGALTSLVTLVTVLFGSIKLVDNIQDVFNQEELNVLMDHASYYKSALAHNFFDKIGKYYLGLAVYLTGSNTLSFTYEKMRNRIKKNNANSSSTI